MLTLLTLSIVSLSFQSVWVKLNSSLSVCTLILNPLACSEYINMHFLLFFCTVNLCRQRLIKSPQREHSVYLWMDAILYLVSLNGAVFHVEIPDFHGQIVPGHDIPPTVAELHIRN
jgi:hypothetical protein